MRARHTRAPGLTARYAMAGLMTLALVSSASARAAVDAGSRPGHAGSSGWARQNTPNALAPATALNGVSCPSASACTAVGQYFNRAGYWAALAEVRKGASWAVQSAPDPAGSTGVTLSGVSCTAAGACTAVGSYVDSAYHTVPLAEAWNGTAWTIQATPSPPGSTDSVLSAVSCTAASACTAVGYYIDSATDTVPLAEAWNGTTWTIQPTRSPPGSPDNVLSGVSCTAPDACMAVGSFISDQAAGTLAEAWNGTSWTIQPTPRPAGHIDAFLAGVSCTAAGTCTAVGGYVTATLPRAGRTLAEAWNGTSWRIQPTPSAANYSVLSGVSCAAAGVCMAVGARQAVGRPELTLTESWDGSSWRIRATPSPAGALASALPAVSCAGPGACTAAGSELTPAAAGLTLAEAWNGTSWRAEASPSPPGSTLSELSGVSCPAAASCTAVGWDQNVLGGTARKKSLAESWNGTSWTIQPTPTIADGSVLSAVSCATASACMAVGYYLDSNQRPVSLAESRAGTSWKMVPTPNPLGAADITLSGVSCTAPDACMAVGSYVSSAGTLVTLAESWNGTSWKIQPTPSPGATFSQLSGVSCTAASACTTVGNDTAGALAEAWNGSSWRPQATPNPAGATRIVLSGVSCTTARTCTAVGSYNNSSGGTVPLAEGERGAAWTIQATPVPRRQLPAALSGVSCTAADACTAVGFRGGLAGQVPLADSWQGTAWTIQATARPARSISSALTGISCPATVVCAAAGSYANLSPDYRTLAEAEGR